MGISYGLGLLLVFVFLGIMMLVSYFQGTDMKPPDCKEIEMNDEHYLKMGHEDWINQCRGWACSDNITYTCTRVR